MLSSSPNMWYSSVLDNTVSCDQASQGPFERKSHHLQWGLSSPAGDFRSPFFPPTSHSVYFTSKWSSGLKVSIAGAKWCHKNNATKPWLQRFYIKTHQGLRFYWGQPWTQQQFFVITQLEKCVPQLSLLFCVAYYSESDKQAWWEAF